MYSQAAVGYEASVAMPHMLLWFLAIMMQPSIPHEVPHEFLTSQQSCPFSVPYPTARTAWLVPYPLLKNIQVWLVIIRHIKGYKEYKPASFQDSRFVVLNLRLTGKHSNHSMPFLVDGIFQVLSVTIASSGVNCVGYFCPRVPFRDTFITSSHFSLICLLPVMYSNTASLLVEPHCVHC